MGVRPWAVGCVGVRRPPMRWRPCARSQRRANERAAKVNHGAYKPPQLTSTINANTLIPNPTRIRDRDHNYTPRNNRLFFVHTFFLLFSPCNYYKKHIFTNSLISIVVNTISLRVDLRERP